MRFKGSGTLGRRARRTDYPEVVVSRPSTKQVLIDVGENLFGRFGIDAVSLREIATAAGQTSSNAVQYHFKDKRGLVDAILYDRLFRHETQRREQLESLLQAKSYGPRDLIRIIWVSLLAIRGPDGQYTHCRFMLQYLLQPQGTDHLSGDLAAFKRSRKIPPELASMAKLSRLLRESFTELSVLQFEQRLKAVATMFLAMVVEHDNAQLVLHPGRHDDFDLEHILDLALAALCAPVAKRPSGTRPV